jgi:hypothetical protein
LNIFALVSEQTGAGRTGVFLLAPGTRTRQNSKDNQTIMVLLLTVGNAETSKQLRQQPGQGAILR